jgi:hypothetical protein
MVVVYLSQTHPFDFVHVYDLDMPVGHRKPGVLPAGETSTAQESKCQNAWKFEMIGKSLRRELVFNEVIVLHRQNCT